MATTSEAGQGMPAAPKPITAKPAPLFEGKPTNTKPIQEEQPKNARGT